MPERLSYRYTTYLGVSAETAWNALTDADLTGRYWGHRNESDWQAGSPWQHVRTDGSGIADVVGTVLAAEPPRRLGRLTVTHENLPTEQDLRDVAHGWPAVFANLKTLLETGDVLPQAPWEMPPDPEGERTSS